MQLLSRAAYEANPKDTEHPLEFGQKDVTEGFSHLTASVARALNIKAPCFQLIGDSAFIGWPADRGKKTTYDLETLLNQTLGDRVSVYCAPSTLAFC